MKRQLPNKFLSAMIAVRALPGSPLYGGDDSYVIKKALEDLEIYQEYKVDGVLLENDFDLPYIKTPLDPKGVLLMKKISKEIRKKFKGTIGIQMLEAANEVSLEIAKDADLDFIRVESYVFAHVGGSGIIEGCAGSLLRKRKQIKAENVRIFADVKKKHCSHSLTSDLDITDEVKQAEFFLVDGIIITSKFTGEKPDLNDFKKVKKVTKLPLIVGSGMTPENIAEYMPFADGFIVGSVFREGGEFLGETEAGRVKKFMKVFNKERAESKKELEL